MQNVVTYPVLLDVANPELKLKPGMTANVSVPVDTRATPSGCPTPPSASGPIRPRSKGGKEAKEAKGGSAAPAASGSASPAASAGGGMGEGEHRRGPREGAGAAAPGGGNGRSGGTGRRATRRFARGHPLRRDSDGEAPGGSVRTGITDGNYTSIESKDLKEGDEIVVGLATAKAMDSNGGITGGGPMGGGARRGGGGR